MRPAPILIALLVLALGLVAYFAMDSGDGRGGLGGPEDGLETVQGDPGDRDLQPTKGPESSENRTSLDPEAVSTTQGSQGEGEPQAPVLNQNILRGTVVSPAGTPLEGCEVTFLAGNTGAFGDAGEFIALDRRPRVGTLADGSFRFEALASGEQNWLMISHPEFMLKVVPGVLVGEYGEYVEPPIVLELGRSVHGRVTTEAGLAVIGADLHLDSRWSPDDPGPTLDRISAVTDGEGRYMIRGVPDGQRFLTVEKEGLGTQTRISSLVFSEDTGTLHEVDFVLGPKALLGGRVLNSDGQGVPGADVIAVDRSAYRDVSNSRCLSGANGEFELPACSSGTYQILYRAPGYEPGVANDVSTPQGQLELVFETMETFEGVVVDQKSGKPLRQFSLRLRTMGGEGWPSAPAEPTQEVENAVEGRFALFVKETRGRFMVEAQAPGYGPSFSAVIDNSAGGPVSGLRIEMTRGGSIRGRVVDDQGQPIPGARAESKDGSWNDDPLIAGLGDYFPTEATSRQIRSDEQGVFRLSNLRAGDYIVLVQSGTLHRQLISGVVVAEGAEVDLGDLLMTPGGTLRGVLYDREGVPVLGGELSLEPQTISDSLPARRVKSDRDGAWRIQNIVPGDYFLVGSPPAPSATSAFMLPAGSNTIVSVTVEGAVEVVRDLHLEDWAPPKPEPPKPPSGQINGRVLDPSGAGVLRASLMLEPKGDREGPALLIGKTERDGEFALLGIAPGEYDLYVVGHEGIRNRVLVQAEQWTHTIIRLED